MQIINFLSGKYDPEYKQVIYRTVREKAKASNAQTVTVKVVSDWGVDEKAKGGRPKKPKVRKDDKRIYAIDGYPAIMQTGGGRYQVQIKHWNRNFYLGVFDTIEEAVRVRDESKAQLIAGTFIYKGQLAVDERPKKRKKSELPKYIYWSRDKGRYLIQRTLNNKKYAHGTYKTLEEAINTLS